MSNAVYLRGTPADREDIVDFANYVFSQAHRPHDFKALLPKAYADDVKGMEGWHFLAKKDGRIRAMVACMPLDLRVQDTLLRCGMVGTVSVHPYARGEGHMKQLMGQMLADAQGKFDLLALGGQRQRYNYFGFEQAAAAVCYAITANSLRHGAAALGETRVTFSDLDMDRQEEVDFILSLMARKRVCGVRSREQLSPILRSWGQKARIIRIDGKLAGYVSGTINELGLIDEEMLPLTVKALAALENLKEIRLDVGPWEKERMAALEGISEGRIIRNQEMISVLNWPKVVSALFALKAACMPLAEGQFTLAVKNEDTFTMRVEKGVPSVIRAQTPPDLTLSHLEAQRLLFGLENALAGGPLPASWLPLPLYFSPVDTF